MRSTQELVDTIYRQAGQDRARIRTVPPLLLRALAITSPVVRELLEMQYQFEEPFIVNSSKITTRLGITATPLDQAIAETLSSYTTTSQTHRERARS